MHQFNPTKWFLVTFSFLRLATKFSGVEPISRPHKAARPLINLPWSCRRIELQTETEMWENGNSLAREFIWSPLKCVKPVKSRRLLLLPAVDPTVNNTHNESATKRTWDKFACVTCCTRRTNKVHCILPCTCSIRLCSHHRIQRQREDGNWRFVVLHCVERQRQDLSSDNAERFQRKIAPQVLTLTLKTTQWRNGPSSRRSYCRRRRTNVNAELLHNR